MDRKEFHIRLVFPWPRLNRILPVLSRWLPSRGNALFTLVMIAALLLASRAGALPLGAPLASAPSTSAIAYQGRLADAAGNPLTSTVGMIFRLYDVASGGVPLWTEQWTGSNSVRVSDGLFNVMLGSLTPIPQSVVTGHTTLFLGITVGSDDEMAPRVQLGSVPYAVQALTVPDGSITAAKLAPDVSLLPPAGSITTTMIADHAVTQVKLGTDVNLVPEDVIRSLNGNNYKVQHGKVEQSIDTPATSVEFTVTFPAPFSEAPIVLVSNCTDAAVWWGSDMRVNVWGQSVSATGFSGRMQVSNSSHGTYRACWIAIGR